MDTAEVSAGKRRYSGKKYIVKTLMSIVVITVVALLVLAIRSCNCNSPSTQINTREITSPKKVIKNNASSAHAIKTEKSAEAEPDNESSTKEPELPPAKPEPKIIDLGTHVEIITH
jgi:hypothetical protein